MKYKLRLDLKLDVGFVTLYRIERLSNGELGGYVESEKNLSQEGSAWVSGNAWVFGNACVRGNAKVSGNACVRGDAQVYGNAKVFGNACVRGDAWVSGNANVFGDACVSGYAHVFGDAQVFGNAWVFGNAQVYGNAWVYGYAKIASNKDILNIIISQAFSITITPQNVAIGCHLKTRKEWLKVTKAQAKEMGLEYLLYSSYKKILKASFEFVKEEK